MAEAKVDPELVYAEWQRKGAETRKFDAEAARAMADAAKATAEARIAAAAAEQAEMLLERDLEMRAQEKAQDHHHLFYSFDDTISSATVDRCITQLTTWMRMNEPGTEMEIQFNSPGGEIVAGMALFDFVHTLRVKGYVITTSAIGMAASMAGILLQAGDKRIMGRQCWLMIHEASFGAVGKFGEVEDRVGWIKQVQERILDIFTKRSSMEKEAIREKWERKDWWISAEEALDLGFIDEIRG